MWSGLLFFVEVLEEPWLKLSFSPTILSAPAKRREAIFVAGDWVCTLDRVKRTDLLNGHAVIITICISLTWWGSLNIHGHHHKEDEDQEKSLHLKWENKIWFTTARRPYSNGTNKPSQITSKKKEKDWEWELTLLSSHVFQRSDTLRTQKFN